MKAHELPLPDVLDQTKAGTMEPIPVALGERLTRELGLLVQRRATSRHV
jgi:hypothetical protein